MLAVMFLSNALPEFLWSNLPPVVSEVVDRYHVGPTVAGMTMLGFSVGTIAATRWAGAIIDKMGYRIAVLIGLAMCTVAASLRMVDSSRSRYLDGQMIQPWHPFTQDSVQKVGSGSLVEVQVEIFPTSAVIQTGHKLRIAVGASDFPHGLPPLPDLVQSILGVLSIYSDAEHPSKVVLPVVPVSAIQ